MVSGRPTGRSGYMLGVLAAAVWFASGCSLILDPDNCADDSECSGGVCQDGICVGGGDPMVDGALDSDGADMETVDVALPDMTPDLGPDVAMPDVDMLPDMPPPAPEPPSCTLTADLDDGALTDAAEIALTATLADPDTPLAMLTVTLDGEPIALDDDTFEGTRPLAEGDNRFFLAATDPDGLRCTASVQVVADRVAPSFAMLNPADGSTRTTRMAALPVSGRIADAHFDPAAGEGAMEITHNGAPLDVEVAYDGAAFSFEVPLAEGANTIELTAIDAVGNRGDAAFEATLDSVPPDVVVEAPMDGSEVFTERINVQAQVREGEAPLAAAPYTLRVTDEAGRVVGGGMIQGVADAEGRIDRQILLALGRNTITLSASDTVGNPRAVEISVTRRVAQACIDITTPLAGAFTDETTVAVSGTVCPIVDGVELRVEGQPPVVLVPAAGGFAGEVVLPGPGTWQIEAVATSPSGEARDTVSVVVDGTAPTIMITAPLRDACTRAQPLRVCGDVRDAESGIATVMVVAGGAEVAVDLPPAGGLFCRDVPVPVGAAQPIVVRAVNRAGIEGQSQTTVRVDRTGPAVCITRGDDCAPVRAWYGANAQGRVRLTGRVDAGTCPAEEVLVAGVPVAVDPQGRFSTERVFADGVQQIELRARDTAGNTSESTYIFRVDTLAPTLDQIEPASGFTTEAQVNLTARAADTGSGVVRVTIDGELVYTAPPGDTGARETPVALVVGLDEGRNEIQVEITDYVGNITTQTVTLRRDTTPPVVAITSPAADHPTPAPGTVTGTIDDGVDGSGAVRVTVNGVEATIDDAGNWIADDVSFDPADPQIVVEAEDALGNTLEAPLIQAATVLPFGVHPPAVDGLAFDGAVGRVGVVDLDRDGRLDVIALAAEADATSMVFRQGADGHFTGRFAAEVGLPENIAVRDAATGDFDADGRLDLFIVGANRIVVLRGNAAGGFGPTAGIAPVVQNPHDVFIGDITRDGLLDAVILAEVGTQLLVGNGDGTFQREVLGTFGLGGLPGHVRGLFVDLTGDAVLDVVATGPGGTTIWQGNRQGLYSPIVGSGFTAGPADTLTPVDADRDGLLDLLVTTADDATVNRRDGGGQFTPVVIASDDAWPGRARGADRLDFDGDGRDDIVVWDGAGLMLYRATGEALDAGGFEAIDGAAIGALATSATTAALGDLDGDGDDDVLVGGVDGLALIRNNLTTLDPEALAGTVVAWRSPEGALGPRDAHGVQLGVDIDRQPDLAIERVVPARATAPTLITFGGAESVNVTATFIDLGNIGTNVFGPRELLPDATLVLPARE